MNKLTAPSAAINIPVSREFHAEIKAKARELNIPMANMVRLLNYLFLYGGSEKDILQIENLGVVLTELEKNLAKHKDLDKIV